MWDTNSLSSTGRLMRPGQRGRISNQSINSDQLSAGPSSPQAPSGLADIARRSRCASPERFRGWGLAPVLRSSRSSEGEREGIDYEDEGETSPERGSPSVTFRYLLL